MGLRFSWADPEEAGLEEKDVRAVFRGFARGDGTKGWPMNLFSDWKSAKVFISEKEVVIVSGWQMKDILRIKTDSITSVSYKEKKPLIPIGSAPHVFKIIYDDQKVAGIRLGNCPTSYPISEKTLENVMEYFKPLIEQ